MMSKENNVSEKRNVNETDSKKPDFRVPDPAPAVTTGTTTLELKEASPNSAPEFPPLDPALLAAINAAIQGAVGSIAAQFAPKSVEVAPSAPVNTLKNPNPPPKAQAYQTKLKGIPVEPGEDLRHVHPNVIKQWFHNLEARWKDQYAQRKRDGVPVSVNWTRG